MNIGYMLGWNEYGANSGVNNHIAGIIGELMRLDNNNKYYAVVDNYLDLPIYSEGRFPQLSEESAKQGITRMLCERYDVELVHSFFYPYETLNSKIKKILTIHDLFPFHYGNNVELFRKSIRESAIISDKIIAVSNYTKQEIIEHLGVSEERIQVIYAGINLKLDTDIDTKPILEKYNLQEEYLMAVSTFKPRKNIKGLIEAFSLFKERHFNNKAKLVLVGKEIEKFDYVREVHEVAKKCEMDIIFTGYTSDQELSALYRGATAVACVSFLEGFGLPVLEAMKYGKAVIASDTTSIPEAGGDAALYCNPYDVESIADAIEEVLLNDEKRREYEQKSVLHVQNFSYRKMAEQTLDLYRSLGAV